MTLTLPCIWYNASDDILWRNMSWTCYWAKDVWILPVHRPSNAGHWVLCIVHLESKELHLFNSFAEQQPWERDIKVSTIYLFRCSLRPNTSRTS
ncbi:uncharacterized protein EDB91DRAFT_1049851 [Suillus paluster]|uniref:uncharacterized protein n=1 Tax=Suillus paluster TaxID=48578 RepID=UPI001B886C56|nr:uncharacterized protein EDB91DRAFT_1049851 [Suillus paluster]KAG1745422.1 hypothetical protein EDB91DRAFT_1049851 [Suillus paluster]